MISLATNDKVTQKGSPSSFGAIIFLICVIVGACYLYRAASVDMFTRVESCFSECSREMLTAQNFIIPLYHGAQFFDKPILAYWLIILAYKTLGISVFAARIPSIIAALLTIVSVAYFARKTYSEQVGIIAAAVLATCIGFSDMASVAMSDMFLCFFEFAALALLYLGYKNSHKRTLLFSLASIAIALGFLTKSLIAILFPCATFLIFLALNKKLNIIRLKHVALGLSIFTIIILPWHIMVYKLCGIRALDWLYLHEQIQRFSVHIADYDFHHPFYYMTLSLLSQLLPWSVFLPIVLWQLGKDMKQGFSSVKEQCSFLLIIFASMQLVLFTLSKSNWGYYNLPICPAASILIALSLDRLISGGPDFVRIYGSQILRIIFALTCAWSISVSYFGVSKIENEAQHSLTELILKQYPKNELIIHMDLFAQYFLCDWMLFKTAQSPTYYYQDKLIQVISSQHKAFSLVMPLNCFNGLPESARNKLRVLGSGKYKFIPFRLSPLKSEPGTDHQVTLVLATNQIDPASFGKDTYEEFDRSVREEQQNVNPKAVIKNKNSISTENESALGSWWLTNDYFSKQKAPDVVLLGSQLGPILGADVCAFKNEHVDIADYHDSKILEHDFKTLLNKDWRVFVASLPSLMISDQLLIARALFTDNYKPKLVAVMVSPRDFLDNCFPSAKDTEAYAFFAKFNDANILQNRLAGLQRQGYSVSPPFNYYADTDSYGERAAPFRLGEPFQKIRSGQLDMTYGSDYNLFKDNTDEYRLRYENKDKPQFAMQMSCLDALLKYLAKQGIQTVVFNSPISEANRKLLPEAFWKSYCEQLNQLSTKNGASFVSADKVVLPFEDKELIDGVHLNLEGAHRWSRVVAVYTATKYGSKPFQDLLKYVNDLK